MEAETVAWPFVLVSAPLWFGLPLWLIVMVTRARVVRIGFGAGLVAALTVLYLPVCRVLEGPNLPIWLEGLLLWGPTSLAVCGGAALADRWFARRRDSVTAPTAHRWTGAVLAAAFAGWSACCGGCVLTPAAEFVDLRWDSPTPGLVLPMPEGLTLVSADRGCGSELCAETYLIGAPDQADLPELTDRLWAHLTDVKGWKRLRDDAGCQRVGWLLRPEFCLFVNAEQRGTVAVLKVHVTGASAVG